MLRKIKVYGRLSKFLGWRTFEADVSNTSEAIRFLLANWPEVRKHMSDQYYKITVGNYNVGEDELHDPAGENEAITIVPVMVGSKGFFKSSVGKIVVGVALVAGAVMLGPVGATYLGGLVQAGAGSAAVIGGFGAAVMAGVGTALVLGGISQAISPIPEYPSPGEFGNGEDALDPQSNYSFGGLQNVSRSGVPVSLVYGWEVLVGSVVVGNGIDTAQIKGTG